MNIQQIQSLLVQRLHGTIQGPVVESYVREDSAGEVFHYFVWEVANGTRLEKAVPYGWEVQVLPMNINKSKLELRISRRLLTDGTFEDGYPVKQTKIEGDDAELPSLYFTQLRRTVTKTKEALPVANVNELPDPATPTGNQMAIKHQKLDDDLYLKEILQSDHTFSIENISIDVDVKPGVKVTTTMKGAATSEIPPLGSGASRLVYRAGAVKVYNNVDVNAVARPGIYGYRTEPYAWGSLLEALSYSITAVPADGGSSDVVYDDEEIVVYRHATVSALDVSGTSKERDINSWGTIDWEGTFATTADNDAQRYKQVWARGPYHVYHNEYATITIGDGSGASIEKDPHPWGYVIWTGTFSDAYDPASDRSRRIWRLGPLSVYLNEVATIEVSGTTKDKDPQPWGTVSWLGTYATTENLLADRAKQIWRLGDDTVFLNETLSIAISGTTIEKVPQAWGALKWTGTYADTQDLDSHRTRQIWRYGDYKVFLNETATVEIREGSFVSYREDNSVLVEEHTTEYAATPVTGDRIRSQVAFALADLIVYENTTITRTAKAPVVYQSSLNYRIPSTLTGINAIPITAKTGATVYRFEPLITEGYSGSLPCEVTQVWQETPATVDVVQVFKPVPLIYQSPLGSFEIGPTLHGAISFTVTVGTEDPTYEFATYPFSAGATSPASVPATFVADIESVPYREGYIVRTYRITV